MTIQVSTVPEANPGTTAKVDRAAYLAQLIQQRRDLPATLSAVQAVRDQASAIAQELAIPSTRDEEWRFTDMAALLQHTFQAASPTTLRATDLAPFAVAEAAHSRLVFVNGVYAPELSDTTALPDGIVVTDLGQAAPEQVTPYLAKQPGADEIFTVLNTASFTDGAVVWVPRNQTVAVPLHLLFLATPGTAATLAHPRCLVRVETGSQVTLLEDYGTVGEGVAFTNPVTEIWLAENAQVTHVRLQRENPASFHIGKTAVSQARDSRYETQALHFGSHRSRHHLEIYQTGEQTHTQLWGLTLLTGEQEADTHSLIDFTQPYGTSDQVNKVILSDRAHGIFNGKINVPQAAQLTNASQLSRNLLLSPKARIDTKPQLEIVADNVKCAHGATVSQLEDDEVFYLQSRGIDADSARKLLVYAFTAEILDELPLPSLRQQLTAAIRDRVR